jgi:hypothetical protein
MLFSASRSLERRHLHISPAPSDHPCTYRQKQTRRHPFSQLLATLRDRTWPTTCLAYPDFPEELPLADLVDSTLMYLRDLFDPQLAPPPLKEVRRVLGFFGWQETDKNSGAWTNLDSPGANIKITTSDSGLLLCHIQHPDGQVSPLLEELSSDDTHHPDP